MLLILLLIGPGNFDILKGHSRATLFLICNNAAQGILSSFFFKYAGITTPTSFCFFNQNKPLLLQKNFPWQCSWVSIVPNCSNSG
jgi:hypothetical protein